MTIAVATGLPMGSALGAFIGSKLIAAYGWESVFILGGVAPFPLIIGLLVALPNPQVRVPQLAGTAAAGAHVGVRGLYQNNLAPTTMLIWAFSFLTFVTMYAFVFWVPILLTLSGFHSAQAALGSAAFGLGGVLGNIVLLPLATRFRVQRLLMFSGVLAASCMGLLGFADIKPAVTLLLIGGVGAGLTTGCVGQAALAVASYPAGLRTTAIGWAAAMGRVGSIAGPLLGGAFLAAGWNVKSILSAGIVPTIVALLMLLSLQRQAAMTDRAVRSTGSAST